MIASTVALVLAVMSHFAATPAQAALRALWFPKNHPATVVRTNVNGRFAVVLTQGGRMEGALQTTPILVERFPDGWQALESLNFACRMEGHGIPESARVSLLAGMPQPQAERTCGNDSGDSGPAADVEALRGVMSGPLTPYVAVAGEYAIGEWYGAGGGQTLFHKTGGTWHRIAGGGGGMDSKYLESLGVPAADLCGLHMYDAKCAH